MGRAFLIAGLAFGDEGKGATTDALCRRYPIDQIIRYNGGCQAAHHVVLSDGKSHCFSQFGAGMLANNTITTYLSRFMLVEPLSMIREAQALSKLTDNVWDRLTVDARAVVVTPYHKHLNRLREHARGAGRHGSCGRGIGVAREMQLKFGDGVLLAGDLKDYNRCKDKLSFIRAELEPEIRELEKRSTPFDVDPEHLIHFYKDCPMRIVSEFVPMDNMVFEGAQGVMLDEKHGTAPHNTWTNTTFGNADTLLDEAGVSDRFRIGCLRTYYTRHGQGPFPTEDKTLDLPEPHNGDSGFQGVFRVGEFDFELAKKAIDIVGGVNTISLSHLDYLPRLHWEIEDFLECLQVHLRTKVGITGYGQTADQRYLHLEGVHGRTEIMSTANVS